MKTNKDMDIYVDAYYKNTPAENLNTNFIDRMYYYFQ